MITTVSREQLEAIAARVLKSEPQQGKLGSNSGGNFLDRFTSRHDIKVQRTEHWQGGRRLILEQCIFDKTHTGTSAALIEQADGTLGYRCQHSSCVDKKWADVREHFEPGYRQRRASAEFDQQALPLSPEMQAVAELLKLDPIARAQAKKAKAKEFGISLKAIDEALVSLQPKKLPQDEAGEVPSWPQLTSPCEQPVDGRDLTNDLRSAIRTFVCLTDEQAIVVALWIIFTWVFEQYAETNPFLRIVSPEPNCGKSTLLEVLELLTRAALYLSTRSHFVRKLQTTRMTFLLDEADAFLQENEQFRGVLDAAHRPHGRTGMSATDGENWTPIEINVFVPLAIASIKKLRRMGTVEQRSIHIWLKRATKEERLALTKARQRTLHRILDPLAERCARWAMDNAHLIGKEPLLDFEDGRDDDKWAPLVAIADYTDPALGGASGKLPPT